jgi:hypothetical protein
MAWFHKNRVRLVLPTMRLAWRYLDDGDSWRAHPVDVPMVLFGSGNLADDFQFYLDGPSSVPIGSLGQLEEWLRGCVYERDLILFGRPDYWQHPVGFEELRRGDCEDHAIWAWRKLIELGFETELMTGRSPWGTDGSGFHAWVVYLEGGTRYLLEPARKVGPMTYPLGEVAKDYHPHLSVDHQLRRHMYAGYVGWLQAERDRRRLERASRDIAT